MASFGRAWKPLTFSNPKFKRIFSREKKEEEHFPDYTASRYYPVSIGEVLRNRSQIVGKLGFGASSTVSLARDLEGRRHVALKLFVNSKALGSQLDHEITIYKRIPTSSVKHPGRSAVRELLDSFDVAGPDRCHRCLVHPHLWESVLTFLHRNPVRMLPAPVLAFVLRRLLLALDYLHTECEIVHTDIKADNIMFGIKDDSWTEEPCIYLSRELQMPKEWGAPVLCDFGSAVIGDTEHTEDVQADIYRAPEVILEAPWSYQIDIWNAGCMIWDLLQPPQALLDLGKSSHRFFTDEGEFRTDIPVPCETSLDEKEISLEGETRDMFLAMMRKMLQWDPSKPSSAKALADNKWIIKNM
ncbi:Putative serine/threonine-protein kinase, active [Colletotrichum destructivum]|uniref:non-specific serine/threonine protein kinase n=1 Tax=Colletotrichum destructivum TaxID=34406 RepID=A0AAX4HW48_9PEZI|nr:Putative serine/threonine-protein kinase, active [Colletotrichum destructivum]